MCLKVNPAIVFIFAFAILATNGIQSVAYAAERRILCQNKKTLLLKTRERCKKNERRVGNISRMTGETGPAGAAGEPGAAGPAGAQGVQGPTGPTNLYLSAPDTDLDMNTRYLAPTGVTTLQASIDDAEAALGTDCTATMFRVSLGTAPDGAQPRDFTVYANQVATAITCSVAVGDFECLWVGRVSISAADLIATQVSVSGGVSNSTASISLSCQS